MIESLRFGLKILCAVAEFANKWYSLSGDDMEKLFFSMGSSKTLIIPHIFS